MKKQKQKQKPEAKNRSLPPCPCPCPINGARKSVSVLCCVVLCCSSSLVNRSPPRSLDLQASLGTAHCQQRDSTLLPEIHETRRFRRIQAFSSRATLKNPHSFPRPPPTYSCNVQLARLEHDQSGSCQSVCPRTSLRRSLRLFSPPLPPVLSSHAQRCCQRLALSEGLKLKGSLDGSELRTRSS